MRPCRLVSIPTLDWNGKSRQGFNSFLFIYVWSSPCFAWPSGGLALYTWIHSGGAPLPGHTQGGWNVQHTARTNGVWERGGMSCPPQYTLILCGGTVRCISPTLSFAMFKYKVSNSALKNGCIEVNTSSLCSMQCESDLWHWPEIWHIFGRWKKDLW